MSSEPIALEAIVHRSEALLSTSLGEDVVMMDVEQGAYYGLEAVAARIWTLTEQPISVGAVCARLASEYEVSPEQCRQEVQSFLGELIQRRIIQVVTPSAE